MVEVAAHREVAGEVVDSGLKSELIEVGNDRWRVSGQPATGRAGATCCVEMQRVRIDSQVGLDQLAQQRTRAAIPPVGFACRCHPSVLILIHPTSVAPPAQSEAVAATFVGCVL